MEGKNTNNQLTKIMFFVIGLALALFHIYTSYFGALPSYQHRVVHLALSMMLVPLCYNLFNMKNEKIKNIFSVGIIAVVSIIGLYSYSIADTMWKSSGTMSDLEIILATVLLVLLLFFTWKTVGAAMPIIAVLCILYALFGPNLPRSLSLIHISEPTRPY